MPLTIKLSRRFCEAVGEGVANEFVDVLNAVVASYRSDVDDTIGREFAVFEARMEQRFTSLEARLDQRITSLESKLDHRIMSARADLDMKWTERWTALDAKLDRTCEKLKSDLLGWMFGFWISTLIGLDALLLQR